MTLIHSPKNKADKSIIGVKLSPHLGDLTSLYLEFCKRIEKGICKLEGKRRIDAISEVRKDLKSEELISEDQLALLFAQNVILDLIAQGWNLKVIKSKLSIFPPAIGNDSHQNAKEVIRNTHLLGRDLQLKEKSVRDFIKGMERRRLTEKGWHSIYSLMRDGRDLAEKLQSVTKVNDENERAEILSKTISPYLQFVGPNDICEHTKLRLGDVWRYFRHTWVNEYKSVPGRSIMVLVRDAAAPNHPVIGIAALGSSVVQHKVRDKWIGWHPESVVDELSHKATRRTVVWLLSSLERLTTDIYVKDLLKEGKLSRKEIALPSSSAINVLLEESAASIKEHRKEPQRTTHNEQKSGKGTSKFWEKEAETFLYRSKRCKQLAKLLNVKKIFQENGLGINTTVKEFQILIQNPQVKAAISQLARMIKAEHVGIDMMDITVCGAIAPYNHLLGGKLVCMMLCSPEVTQHYFHRYESHTSIIASAMKGKPVIRKPKLVLLCTTSLYGVGSSQYNRIKIPLSEIGLISNQTILFKDLGHSEGFGTYHFSRSTVQLGSVLNSRKKEGRRVNSIFGEGVNPLMRKIRESLDFVGLNSDLLLQHGNKRVTYGIQLAENFREILLGQVKEPKYLIPQTKVKKRTTAVALYWQRRWLSQRIRPDILAEVSRHILSYPPSHGAAVPLEIEDDLQDLSQNSGTEELQLSMFG